MPPNPETIIIQWHSERGDTAPNAATADVTVLANGQVAVGPRFAHGTSTTHQLSPAELATLCRFVFEQQDIWSIDSDTLEREVTALRSAGSEVEAPAPSVVALGPEAVADAATTVIRVRDDNRDHEVRYYNLAGAARRYPHLGKLQRLRAIETRLLELAQQIVASR